MNIKRAERKALKAANRAYAISVKAKAVRRFWICTCGYKTIGRKPQACRDCGTKMKPDRAI